jgi:hypothetical protein
VTVLLPTWRWNCPKCSTETVSHEAEPHSKLHRCSGKNMNGLITPMVQVGTKADIKVVEREDYINGDKVQLHDGRPVMAVTVERPDGQDSIVFAPAATGGA